MNSSESVLFIPGLGGEATITREKRYVAFLNRRRGKKSHILFFDPLWHTNETYDDKHARLDRFYTEHDRPSKLFAFSAGVALASVLIAEHAEVTHAHLVCGKALEPSKIHHSYRNLAPAFIDAVIASDNAIHTGIDNAEGRINCYVPARRLNDGVIERVDMIIPDAKVIELPALTHTPAIVYALLRYLPII